jgi:hypothetical protein
MSPHHRCRRLKSRSAALCAAGAPTTIRLPTSITPIWRQSGQPPKRPQRASWRLPSAHPGRVLRNTPTAELAMASPTASRHLPPTSPPIPSTSTPDMHGNNREQNLIRYGHSQVECPISRLWFTRAVACCTTCDRNTRKDRKVPTPIARQAHHPIPNQAGPPHTRGLQARGDSSTSRRTHQYSPAAGRWRAGTALGLRDTSKGPGAG